MLKRLRKMLHSHGLLLGKRKQIVDAIEFIGEEDVVSSEAEESDHDGDDEDEDEDLEESSYDDSFIDSPSSCKTYSSGTDMMPDDRQSLHNDSPSWFRRNHS